MNFLARGVMGSSMNVCGISVPLPLAPALSTKLDMDSGHPPISGSFMPSFAIPLATAASSGPMPQIRIACAPAVFARTSWAVMSLSPMLNFSTATTSSLLPCALTWFCRSSRPETP